MPHSENFAYVFGEFKHQRFMRRVDFVFAYNLFQNYWLLAIWSSVVSNCKNIPRDIMCDINMEHFNG